MLECVVNVSEGRDRGVITRLVRAGGAAVLDVHQDADHHRSVFTLAGAPDELEAAVRSLARATVTLLDLRGHVGVHPRIGVLDVVPFVAFTRAPGPAAGRLSGLAPGSLDRAVTARDRFAAWAGRELGLPCFLYGPHRSLPDLRRRAWVDLAPDQGPSTPHRTAGATAVGARPALVAYNLWLSEGTPLETARAAARGIRGPGIRALGLAVAGGRRVQVSCNLIDPWRVGPGAAFDAVSAAIRDLPSGSAEVRPAVTRAELVGLLPQVVLHAEPAHRWRELGISPAATIEARLEAAGLDGGRF